MGSGAPGRLGAAPEAEGDGVLPLRRSRLVPPMWFECLAPGKAPVMEGWDLLPRGRGKRGSSSSLPPSSARLSGGSMAAQVWQAARTCRLQPMQTQRTQELGTATHSRT